MAQKNLIGRTVMGYQIVEELGSGAFGTVYKAVKRNESGEYVRALKHIILPTEKQYTAILSSMGGDIQKTEEYFSEMLNSIVGEIHILNDLSEKDVPNVVRYYENEIITSETPTQYNIFILMEYLTPLEDFIKRNDFEVKDVIYLGLDLLKGLEACHNNGVIHRDIKPDNIFVTSNIDYKLGDFGVSKVLDGTDKAESLKGTFDYLAPEVYVGKEGYNKTVDIYSLGIALYRLLNYNRNPFLPPFPEQYFNEDEEEAFSKRMIGTIPDLPALGGKELGEVIVKAISPQDQRYQSAQEFYDALESVAQSMSDEDLQTSVKNENLYSVDFVEVPDDLDETVGLIDDEATVSGLGFNDESYTAAVNDRKIDHNLFDAAEKDMTFTHLQDKEPEYLFKNGVAAVENPDKSEGKKSTLKWVLLGIGLVAILGITAFMLYQIYSMNSNVYISSPTYSVLSGSYTSPQAIKIQTSGDDLDIYYTIDGTEPTTSSMHYTPGEEIQVQTDTTIKSIAVDKKGHESEVSTASYAISTNVASNSGTGKKDNQEEADYATTVPNVTSNNYASSPFNVSSSYTSWNFRDQNMMNLFSAYASSTLPNDGSITYGAINVLDNDSKTAWSESVEGVGIGESITLTYKGSSPYTIRNIYFLNGYTKTAEVFNMNTTPTSLTVEVNSSVVGTINLKANPDPQVVTLPSPITLHSGDSITFVIKTAAPGPNDDVYDTNISEIRFTS